MAWAITYNLFGSAGVVVTHDWDAVDIVSYAQSPVLAENGRGTAFMEHKLTGTALVSATTSKALEEKLATCASHLSVPQCKLLITAGGSDPAPAICDIDPEAAIGGGKWPDQIGSPRCVFSWEKIMGVITALVRFEFTWHKWNLENEDDPNDVVSHVWSQSFDIAENGLQTMTVVGALEVRYSAVGDTGHAYNRGPNPDDYRALVFPAIPNGFRHKKFRFLLDNTGTKLAYNVTFQEHFRGLPAPARVGTGQFIWRRALDSSFLGKKIFDAELEGDRSATPQALMAELLKVARRRIIFSGPNADIIQSIEVTEHDIFSKNRIGLRIEAMGTGGGQPGYDMVVLGSRLFDDLMTGPSGQPNSHHALAPPIYGSAGLKGLALVAYTALACGESQEANAPPWSRTDQDPPDLEEIDIAVADDAAYEAIQESLIPEGVEGDPDPDHMRYPYLEVTAIERAQIATGITTLVPRSLEQATFAYQMKRPKVKYVSEFIVRRLNKAPHKVMFSPPVGAVLIAESHEVKPGTVDANGNREFQAVYRREFELVDTGPNSDFYVTDEYEIGGFGTACIRRWLPPLGIMRMPHDPTVLGATPVGTVFDNASNPLFEYGIESHFYV